MEVAAGSSVGTTVDLIGQRYTDVYLLLFLQQKDNIGSQVL